MFIDFPREIQRMVILNLSQAPHSGVSMNSAILTEVALPSAEAVMQHQSWRWFVHLDWVYHKKALGWTWMCIPAGKCIIRIWTQKKSLNQLLKCYISIWFYMHISCYMSETTEREVWLYSNPNYSEKDRKANSKPLNLKPQSIYIYTYIYQIMMFVSIVLTSTPSKFRPHLHLHLLRQLHGSPWQVGPLRQRGAAQDLRQHRSFAVQRLGCKRGTCWQG